MVMVVTFAAGYHVLAKPTGSICNLDCEYCFFLSKEMLYPGDRFRMADELLETYLRQLLESHRTPEVAVAWQGGEPTMMGLDFYRRSVELVDELKRPDQRIQYTIQTNGVLLDQEWAEFLEANDVLVGLSVDGPRQLHDRYRVDKRGLGSFDRVMAGYEHLRTAEVDVNVLCTVHAGNQGHPLEVYRFFRDEMGVNFIQFIPVVERTTETMLPIANTGWKTGDNHNEKRPLYVLEGNLVTDRTVEPEAFGRFLTTVFDEWSRNDVGEVFVQHFDTALANWYGEPGGVCVFSETCGAAVALEHNGDVYSCDHFVEPDYRLGNITETPLADLVRSDRQERFGRDKRDTLPEFCRSCDVRFACQGGCPKNRFRNTPDGEPGVNYLCAGYQHFFHHIDEPMTIMCDLLREGRAPAELPSVLAQREAARFAGVGRNEPCPCGSGDKYKKCHGAANGTLG
ncbi:MAG: anaerobic sulfatase maturase [Actinomycetia bacterium]|nr:anaerobic sulfatase maturase [Actinomycetes bacterium]